MGVCRLYARIRSRWARDWERTTAQRACFSNAAGRRVGDGVWRFIVRANLTRARGIRAAEILRDSSNAFERVSVFKLVRLALACGYPPPLLRYSVASYRWQRYLSDGRLVTTPVRAMRRAIVAGSSFATLELKVMM